MSLLCGLQTPRIFPSVLWGGLGRGLPVLREGGTPQSIHCRVFEASTVWTFSVILPSEIDHSLCAWCLGGSNTGRTYPLRLS